MAYGAILGQTSLPPSATQVTVQASTASEFGITGDSNVDAVLQAAATMIGEGARVVTGSYVGTGQEGASYPTSITFPFTPKIVLISNDYGNYSVIQWNAPRFIYLYRTGINSLYMSICDATYTTNKISWYREDSGGYGGGILQLNSSGGKYNYTAFE